MIRQCLKIFALALIVFPEPVTTALGIALLSCIAALSLQKRLSKFGDLEGLVKKSLKTTSSDKSVPKVFNDQDKVFHKIINVSWQPEMAFKEPTDPDKISAIARVKLILNDQHISNIDSRRFNKIRGEISPPVAGTKLNLSDQQTSNIDIRRFNKIRGEISPPVARTKLSSDDQPTSNIDTRHFSKIGLIRPAAGYINWFDSGNNKSTSKKQTGLIKSPTFASLLN